MLRQAILGLAAMVAATAAGPVMAQEPIRIGEINSYSGMAAFTVPYRQGWTLALEEVNAAGGVLGRKLEVVARDDGGKPEDAVRLAAELVANEKVAVLAGTFFSHIGLAVSDYARQHKVLFLGSEPLTDALTWSKGHRYAFRLRPSTYMQAAMLAEEAAKLPARRWATVAPNYEYGQSAVAAFKQLLLAKRPDVEFVSEQWPAQGKIDAGATAQAVALSRPDAIFNVTFGPDLGRFVREGNTRGLFRNRAVVSLLTGEPEYLDPLKDETPEGWIVTGYPWESIDTPEHKTFRDAYRARFNDYPRLGSVVGYGMIKSIAAAIAKAGSTDTEKLVDAMRGLTIPSPFGPMEYRAIDHQSTLGAYVGRTTVRDGKGIMVEWRYADGAKYLPDDATVRKLRPQE
ncbi:ABC transporter substrate-binding protein [Allostella vacuolata]|nr:ABC transporter substrate-binding protein [Stella vacuolata]